MGCEPELILFSIVPELNPQPSSHPYFIILTLLAAHWLYSAEVGKSLFHSFTRLNWISLGELNYRYALELTHRRPRQVHSRFSISLGSLFPKIKHFPWSQVFLLFFKAWSWTSSSWLDSQFNHTKPEPNQGERDRRVGTGNQCHQLN